VAVLVAAVASAAFGLPAPAGAAPEPVQCRYVWTPAMSWPGGFWADLYVTNRSGAEVNGWSVEWTLTEPTQLGAFWSAAMSQPEPHRMVARNLVWNGRIPDGSTIGFGWTAFAAGTQIPTDITVNGVPC
jgi:hypothetical protein